MWWVSRIAQVLQSNSEEINQKLRDKAYNKQEEYQTGSGSFDFLSNNPRFRCKDRLSSAYISPDGKIHILRSHTHDETARTILTPIVERNGKILTRSERHELDSRAMSILSGVIRAQFYHDGVGVTINMVNLPTSQQIQALKEHYDRTRKEVFVAEIIHGKDMLAHITDYNSLMSFLNNYKKPDNEDEEQESILKQLRQQLCDEENKVSNKKSPNH